MKILQFGRFYPPSTGGIQQVMFEISEGITKEGYTCDVLCSNTKAKYVEDKYEKYTVFRTISYGMVLSTSITPQLIFKLYKLAPKYDIIHVQAPDPMSFLALFLVRPKAKVVIHWQSDIVRQHITKKFFLPLQNWVLRFASKIILTSQNYSQHSHDLKNFTDKIEVIPLGISNKHFIANKDNVSNIQKKYHGKRIILSIGRLVSYKGFMYLVESAKYLDDDVIILIAGKGCEEDKLQNIIIENKLQNKVKLIGYITQQEKYDYLQACYIFCLPSITKVEAFGVAIIEAMSFSKPIVSSNMNNSGISWVNKDGDTGIQVDIKSPKQLANAFKKILNDTSLYNFMAKNSFARFNKLFTRQKMVQSTIKLYKSLL